VWESCPQCMPGKMDVGRAIKISVLVDGKKEDTFQMSVYNDIDLPYSDAKIAGRF
jgi:hypothetical protein